MRTEPRFVRVQDVYEDGVTLLKAGRLAEGEERLHAVLNVDLNNPAVLYNLAHAAVERGQLGLAILMFQEVVEAEPQWHMAWDALGVALAKANRQELARTAYQEAVRLEPNVAGYWSNLGASWVNQGNPDKVLEYMDKALALDPKHPMTRWQKCLGHLEKQDWPEAWKWHGSRLEGGAGTEVALRNYHRSGMTPWWDGKSKGLVVVHGEQGLGDEIMFASCIPDAVKTGARIVIEPNPRLTSLFRRSFPDCEVYGTHKTDGSDWRTAPSSIPGLDLGAITSEEMEPRVDFKCALGTLPEFYRLKDSDFPGTPYLVADPEKVAQYRARIRSDRMRVGIAWQGGVGRTRVDLRSLSLGALKFVLEQDCDFVSLNYVTHSREDVERFKAETGIEVHHWPDAVEAPADVDELAAVIGSCDLVVTVCQTALHAAGAMGKPCWVMVPSKPDWRVSTGADRMPWYRSVRLFHQKGDSWGPAIEQVAMGLRSRKAA